MVMEEKGYSIPIYEDGIKTEWSVDGIIGDHKWEELIRLGDGKLPIMINVGLKKAETDDKL
jgi:hypothetical protein